MLVLMYVRGGLLCNFMFVKCLFLSVALYYFSVFNQYSFELDAWSRGLFLSEFETRNFIIEREKAKKFDREINVKIYFTT